MVDYYVRISGNDANDGLTPITAWRTIAYAIANTTDFDTVYIGAGNYGEALDLTGLDRRTFIGDIRGLKTGDVGHPQITYIRAHHGSEEHFGITVKGFHCLSYTSFGDYNASVDVGEVEDVRIEKCILDYGCYAIGIGSSGSGFVFQNNVVWPMRTSLAHRGCLACGASPHLYIYHNTFVGIPKGIGESHWVGPLVELYGYSTPMCHFIVKNNIGYQASLSGKIYYVDAYENGSHIFNFDHNCYYIGGSSGSFMDFYLHPIIGPTEHNYFNFGEWQTTASLIIPEFSIISDPNSFVSDPLLEVDEYHLTKNSPCIDIGVNLGVSEDIDEDFRPLGFDYDIGCDEYYFIPSSSFDTFSFEVSPRISRGPVLIRVTPYREPQLKWPCTHYLPNRDQFTLNTCPRCLGTGFYYDIQFDAGGLVPQVWDETKLAQELEKVTITDFNPFHPEYGANLKKRVGQVPIDDLKPIIKSDILNAIFNLMKYQKREANKGVGDGYFSPRELIDSVEKVEITELSATELNFAIYILTVEGKEIEITGKVLV
jgi:hypothetical protein